MKIENSPARDNKLCVAAVHTFENQELFKKVINYRLASSRVTSPKDRSTDVAFLTISAFFSHGYAMAFPWGGQFEVNCLMVIEREG